MAFALTVTDLKQDLSTPGGSLRPVLKGVTFSIPTGSLSGFIGANGAGKTTTIKALLGFIQPKSGQIQFFGEPGLTRNHRNKLGFMPERPYFYDFLTGKEFLALHWKLHDNSLGPHFEQRCDEVLKAVDLERGKNLRLRQFSKGMLQRIGIAQAIIHEPQLVILDEPMSGLDPDGRVLIKSIIKNLHRKGTTLFFSSHLLQDMEELCDRLVIIDQGTTIFEGDLKALGAHWQELYRVVWREGAEPNQIKSALFSTEELQEHIDQIRSQKFPILQIAQEKLSLEEAFVHLRKDRETR